jgi:hypothetical protein
VACQPNLHKPMKKQTPTIRSTGTHLPIQWEARPKWFRLQVQSGALTRLHNRPSRLIRVTAMLPLEGVAISRQKESGNTSPANVHGGKK